MKTTITVCSLELFKIAGAAQSFHRPYTILNNSAAFLAVLEHVKRIDKTNAMDLAGVASNFIGPSVEPGEKVFIKNDWEASRYAFRLILDIEDFTGGKANQIVTGFTDTDEFTPETEFYINTVTTNHNHVIVTPTGKVTMERMTDNSHILANYWQDHTVNSNIRTMRPEDVFSSIVTNNLLFGMSDPGVSSLYDTRNITGKAGIKSQRDFTSPATYLAKIVESYGVAMTFTEMFNRDSTTIYGNAGQHTACQQASSDLFLRALRDLTGSAQSSFTSKDLIRIDPDVSVKISHWVSPVEATKIAATNWKQADAVTIAAWTICGATNSLASELMLTEVKLTSSNRYTENAKPSTVITAAKSISSALVSKLEAFIYRFENEIMKDVTYNGIVDYIVELNVNHVTQTSISISMGGNPAVDYVFPSFADALLSPVIATSLEQVQQISGQVEELCTYLSNETNNF